jgi:N6-adenosine-specific RNA methylase IME4
LTTGDDWILGAFQLTPTGLTVRGQPSFDEWQDAGTKLSRMEGAVQFWIGDWLNAGEQRYREKYAQAVNETQVETWMHYAWVSNKVQICTRVQILPWSYHREVAHLDPPTQSALLAEAVEKGWKRRQLTDAVRARAHGDKVAAITAGRLPSGVYDVICADPPWRYDNSGFDQSAAAQYPTLDVQAICDLPETDPTFPKFAEPSVIFVWATSPLLPAAVTVLTAWGFEYKACLVWVKDRAPGLGWWLKTRHELLLVGVRGSMTPLEKVDSVIIADVDGHSHKPDIAYAVIAQMFPGLRYVECFARTPRDGWDVWGNEV